MAWDQPPVAVCQRCGGYLSSHNAHLIAQPCRRQHEDDLCGGRFENTLSINLWRHCTSCDEEGCPSCHGSGWLFVGATETAGR
jgi:hypothetical protein